VKPKAKARQSYVLKEPLWWKIGLCSFSFIIYHDYDVASFFCAWMQFFHDFMCSECDL